MLRSARHLFDVAAARSLRGAPLPHGRCSEAIPKAEVWHPLLLGVATTDGPPIAAHCDLPSQLICPRRLRGTRLRRYGLLRRLRRVTVYKRPVRSSSDPEDDGPPEFSEVGTVEIAVGCRVSTGMWYYPVAWHRDPGDMSNFRFRVRPVVTRCTDCAHGQLRPVCRQWMVNGGLTIQRLTDCLRVEVDNPRTPAAPGNLKLRDGDGPLLL